MVPGPRSRVRGADLGREAAACGAGRSRTEPSRAPSGWRPWTAARARRRPGTWWFQRGWTDTGQPRRAPSRLVPSSPLDNCELQYVLGAELGLGRPVGYQAWVGSLVHRLIEDCERGEVAREPDARRRGRPPVAAAGVPRQSGIGSLARAGQGPDAAELVPAVRSASRRRHGARVRVRLRRRDDRRLHRPDRARPRRVPGQPDHRLQDRSADRAPKANESLQLGIYYLAVLESAELREFQPVSGVELSYLKGDWRNGDLDPGVDRRHAGPRGGVPERDARAAVAWSAS